ncbi:MAG: nitroreductase family protein [Anaerolineae bacterium]|nr:nitroreductase family protein [Anaerolineae bacterium]
MTAQTIPLDFERLPPDVQIARSRAFWQIMRTRRSVRDFSTEDVPLELIENAIRAAAGAPSGANQQPWTFVVVRDPEVKRRIRSAAEAEERESYERRMSAEWLQALEPLGTDWHKPHLEQAPLLIVVFAQTYGVKRGADGAEERVKHYYVTESVGIAVGFLLCALHHAGLATLTHTPNPMAFLSEILERPANERAVVVIPVGYPVEGTQVPAISKKPLDEVMKVL